MKLAPKDLLIGIAVTVLWGCNFSMIEWGLQSMDPFLLTLLRFVFCAVPAVFFIAKPKDVSYVTLALYGSVFGAGLWWVVNFAMFNGLSPGMSSVFLQFSAFFTIIASSIFLKERFNSLHFAGMLFSAIGLVMILTLSESRSTAIGILLVLAAALAWSFCNLLVKVKKPADMLAFIVWSSLFSVPAILMLTLLIKGIEPFDHLIAKVSWAASFSILFQAYVTTLLGYSLWNNLMKKYPASLVAPLSLIVPTSGLLASFLFYGEALTLLQGLALGFIFIGLMIFILGPRVASRWPSNQR